MLPAGPPPAGTEGATEQVPPELTQTGFMFGTIQFVLMAFIVYYLLVLHPSKLRQDNQTNFIKNLKKGDEVVTSSGILARVISVKPEYITLEIASNVRIKLEPAHVRAPVSSKGDSKGDSKPAPSAQSGNNKNDKSAKSKPKSKKERQTG